MSTPIEATPETAEDMAIAEVPVVLPGPQRLHILAYCGALLLLLNLAAPYAGLIGIPISFFLKNKLHLGANQLAQFNLWIGIPLYVSFVFGFVRDRWSPFGAGDRGHLILFGLTTAVIYAGCAFLSPTYSVLLAGLLIVTISVQFVASAANALVSEVGQRHLMTGQASSIFNVSVALPAVAAFLGGLLSDVLERQATGMAARVLFLVAAALMVATALLGFAGPKWLFAEARPKVVGRTSPLERYRPAALAGLGDLSAADHADPVGLRTGDRDRAAVPSGQ